MVSKKIFHLAACFAVIISVFFVISNTAGFLSFFKKTAETKNKSYNNSLKSGEDAGQIFYYKDLVLEKIYLNNDASVYSLKDGEFFKDGVKLDPKKDEEKINKILRLALFYQWSKEDPLLASATLDSEKLGISVDLLKNTQNEFLKKYNWQDQVFPVDFLGKFIESSKSQKKFLGEISESNAAGLIDKIESVNNAYYEDAKKLKKAVMGSESNEYKDRQIYAALGGSTYSDVYIISGDLEKIKENSKIAGKEIGERKKCLFASWKFCRRPTDKFTEPEIAGAQEIAAPDLFTTDELNLAGDKKYFGPYRINSPCWQKKDVNYLYVSKEVPENLGDWVETSYLATDMYYSTTGGPSPFEVYMGKKGVELIPQPGTTPYTCINLEYQAKLAVLNYFYNEFKEKRFYSAIKKTDDFKNFPQEFKSVINRGEEEEKRFFDSQYPDEDSLERLAGFYGFTYRYLAEHDLADAKDKEDILNRYLLVKEKMSDIDLVLNKIAFFFSDFNQKPLIEGLPKFYIYPIRSNYSLMFFDFSLDVWRSGDKPQYLTLNTDTFNDDYSIRMGIMDRKMAILKYGKEKLDNWLAIYNQDADKRHNRFFKGE